MLGLSNEIPLSFFHLLPLSIHKNLFFINILSKFIELTKSKYFIM